MIGTKTRIWRGGMSEIMRPAREGQPDTDAAHRAQAAPQPEPVVTPSEPSAPSARPSVQTQVTSLRKPRVGSGTLVGHVFDLSGLSDEKPAGLSSRRSSPLSTTRLVPIEELLVGHARPEPAPTPAEASESRPRARAGAVDGPSSDFGVERALGLSKRRVTGEHVRRGLIALLLPLTIWVFVNRQRGDVAVPTLPQPAATESLAGPAVVAPSAPARQEPTPAAASMPVNTPVSVAVPSARQRAAVDALVAGDFVSARRIYGELASSTDVGDPRVFAEAARILDERMHANKK